MIPAQQQLLCVNAVSLAAGATSLVVAFMSSDTIATHLAAVLGVCCGALGILGLVGRGRSLRAYGTALSVLSLLGVWGTLVVWCSADMAVRVFGNLAASDWEGYFDTLEPSYRHQVLAAHPGCDVSYTSSCWDVVQEHTAGKYFSASRVCLFVGLGLGLVALSAVREVLPGGTARLVSDLDLALNYIVLLFGVSMVGGAAAEYGMMTTSVGRTFCWTAISAGLTLMLITLCSFLTKAGARAAAEKAGGGASGDAADLKRTVTATSSSLLSAGLFLLAQALFVVALGCFLAKHTLLESLHEQLDEHALQDVLSEYQHIAGCGNATDSDAVAREESNSEGFSCETSRLAWADAERVFRRQLDTIGWGLLLATLLVVSKLYCGRHADALLAPMAEDNGAGGGGGVSEYATLPALEEGDESEVETPKLRLQEQREGVSRGSSPNPGLSRVGGGGSRSSLYHQSSGISAIPESSLLLGSPGAVSTHAIPTTA